MKRSVGRQRLRRKLKRHGTLCESRAVCFGFSTLLRGVRNGHAEKEAFWRFGETFRSGRKQGAAVTAWASKGKRPGLLLVFERQVEKSHDFGILVFLHREENVGVFAEGFALNHRIFNIFVRGEKVRLVAGGLGVQSCNVALLVFVRDGRLNDEQMTNTVRDRVNPFLTERISQR